MNPFQRARTEATKVRALLIEGASGSPIPAKTLLAEIEEKIGIAIEPIAPCYPDLGGGTAVLQREQMYIYVNNQVPLWGEEFCGLVAHELGHWYLDATKQKTTVAHLKALFDSDGSPGLLKVEAYGARERQELQANVFARELLLPRELARRLAFEGKGPITIAKQLGVPVEFVRLQMLDALLLPDVQLPTSGLEQASPDQLAAARAEERAANVVAGPGTGKTTTLIHRVKYLVEEKKVKPNEILVLTFTNKAASELVERLRSAGIDDAADVWAGTFHAFGLEFLRKYHQHFGLDSDLRVADTLSSLTMLVAVLPQLELKHFLRVEDPHDWLRPVLIGITRLKEELVSPTKYRNFVEHYPAKDAELQRRREDVATLYEAHERLLGERKTLDFVDLISKPALALAAGRASFSELVDQFKYVLVDEYQDVTQAMVELLRQLAHKKSIWVVGDIRQAIHHWRGASLKSLMRFDSEFKAHAAGTTIQRYALESNRRSFQEVLDLVHDIGRRHVLEPDIKLDATKADKGYCGKKPTVVTCKRRDDIIASVKQKILNLKEGGVDFGNQAVLCRAAADLQKTAEALSANGIPVVYIGDLYQRPEIKKLLCLMQILVERQPRALIGLFDVPELSMPLPDILHLLKAATADISFQRGRWIEDPPEGLTDIGLAVIGNLRKLLHGLKHSSNPWGFVCDMLLEHKFCLPPESDCSVEAWVQRIALWQFAYAVRNGNSEAKEARLSRFLMRQRLRQRIGDSQVQRELPPEASILNGVRMLTVHASKGLEFEAVHVAFVTAGSYGANMPSWTSPDNVLDIVPPEALGSNQQEYEFEEAVERNNLLYVAVSRAKQHLYLYQEIEYNEDNLTPQLKQLPKNFISELYTGPALLNKAFTARKAFTASNEMKFEHFDNYVMCPLQYWYSQVIGLRSEADIDVSVRAKSAVMAALKQVASAVTGSPEFHLSKTWKDGNLPVEELDPSLWRDASLAFGLGLKSIRSIVEYGGQFAEPTTAVNGVTIQMPWGFFIKTDAGTEFAMMRFARRRVSDISTVLKPMVSALSTPGQKTMSLTYVLTDKVDDVPCAKKPEMTKSFKTTARLFAGDNQPSPGRHCSRCGFSTICPSAPSSESQLVSGTTAAG